MRKILFRSLVAAGLLVFSAPFCIFAGSGAGKQEKAVTGSRSFLSLLSDMMLPSIGEVERGIGGDSDKKRGEKEKNGGTGDGFLKKNDEETAGKSLRGGSAASGKKYKVNRLLIVHYSGALVGRAAEYLKSSLDELNKGVADMAVIALNSPGGSDSAMHAVSEAILRSGKPVAVYVYPPGSASYSAGAFIAASASALAMAPDTEIGAASTLKFGDIPIIRDAKALREDKKILSDSLSYLAGIGSVTGRDISPLIKILQEGRCLKAEEAVKLGAADFMAGNIGDLARKLNGLDLKRFGKLDLSSVRIEHRRQSAKDAFLSLISIPDIALLLMAAGVVGIFIEIYSPGLMIPGIVGIISLVTSFYAFQALSANLAGILLVFVSFIFFLLEIKIMSYGLLSVGGAVSLLLGVMLLFDGSAGGLGVSPKMIIITITGIVLIVFVLAYIVFKAQVGRVVTGKEALVGERGVADTGLSPKGKVLVAGELWDAESEDGGTIPAGSEIIVSAVNGFRLRVSRLTERAE